MFKQPVVVIFIRGSILRMNRKNNISRLKREVGADVRKHGKSDDKSCDINDKQTVRTVQECLNSSFVLFRENEQ